MYPLTTSFNVLNNSSIRGMFAKCAATSDNQNVTPKPCLIHRIPAVLTKISIKYHDVHKINGRYVFPIEPRELFK